MKHKKWINPIKPAGLGFLLLKTHFIKPWDATKDGSLKLNWIWTIWSDRQLRNAELQACYSDL